MPTIKNLTEETAAVVGLPEYAQSFSINKDDGCLYYIFSWNGFPDVDQIILPPGSWSIVGWSDELTEDQCADFVDSWESVSGDGTIIYQRYPDEIPKCRTAIKSFQSLLRSHGITDRALIIKKEK